MSRPRHGFTAIELTVVLAVVVMMVGSAAPSLLTAMRKGRVNQSANAISAAHAKARQLAMSAPETGVQRYGVVLDMAASPPYVAVTRGATATPNDILMVAGEAVYRQALNPNVSLLRDGTDVTGVLAWRYRPRTGEPIDANGNAICIGAPAGAGVGSLARSLVVQTMTGDASADIVILDSGVGHARGN